MQPYNFKVWGIDPARMSSDWIAGRVLTPVARRGDRGLAPARPAATWARTPGSAIRSAAAARCSSPGLAQRVQARGGAFMMNRSLVRLDPKRRRATFRVEEPGSAERRYETIRYDTLFPSVPLPDLIAAIDGAPEAVRRAAAGLPSTAVVCVNLGINREKVTEKHWIYYPEGQDKYIFQRIFVQSNASPFTAPPGHSALTFEISHSKFKPLPVRGQAGPDRRLRRRPEADRPLAGGRRGGLRAGARACRTPTSRSPRSGQGSLDVINEYLHGLGIYPIGRFGEWKYLNQDGAILSAKRVVESVQSGEAPRASATVPVPPAVSARTNGAAATVRKP